MRHFVCFSFLAIVILPIRWVVVKLVLPPDASVCGDQAPPMVLRPLKNRQLWWIPFFKFPSSYTKIPRVLEYANSAGDVVYILDQNYLRCKS